MDLRKAKWYTNVRVYHGRADGEGWSQRAERFVFQFEARERALDLRGRTLPDLYKYVLNPSGAKALMRGEDLVPSDRWLVRAEVVWGSVAARGREHGRYEVRSTILYECDCGEIFTADVDPVTMEPVGGHYGPCPACGQVTEPGGQAIQPA